MPPGCGGLRRAMSFVLSSDNLYNRHPPHDRCRSGMLRANSRRPIQPKTSEASLERMQPKARNVHIIRPTAVVQCRKDVAKFFNMRGRHSSCRFSIIKGFEPAMFKRLIIMAIIDVACHLSIDNFFRPGTDFALSANLDESKPASNSSTRTAAGLEYDLRNRIRPQSVSDPESGCA